MHLVFSYVGYQLSSIFSIPHHWSVAYYLGKENPVEEGHSLSFNIRFYPLHVLFVFWRCVKGGCLLFLGSERNDGWMHRCL
jgi:hypothetical protein